MIGRILKQKGNELTVVTLEQYKGQEIIDITDWTKTKDRYSRLSKLYHLFINTLSKETGDSTIYWDYELKRISGFGNVIINNQGDSVFVPLHFTHNDDNKERKSKLFKDAFGYCFDNNIMDCQKFMQDYFEITGKNLVNF